MDHQEPIFGRYEVHGLIGRGGMAEVFRAYAVGAAGFRRPVVIKRILPSLAESAEFVDMFIAEATTAALLDHPNIVQVFDLGEHDGDLFMVMELVDGTDFGSLVRSAEAEGRLLAPELVAYAMVDVCKALERAHGHRDEGGHARPVIHRDVSPHNVLVSRSGAVKLGDFGLALPTGDVRRTTPGIVKGKLGYMSPEQARGVRDLDGRSDLFSLGIVMYEALSGRRLFVEPTPADTVRAVQRAEVEPLESVRPGLPPELAALVGRLLAKGKEDRPATAAEARRMLAAYLRTVSPPVGPEALAREVGIALDRPRPEPDPSDLVAEVGSGSSGSGSGARAATPATQPSTAPSPPPLPPPTRRERPSRVPASVPVRARFGGTTYTLQTADVSAGGFFVVTDRPQPLHSLVQLRLILPPESAEVAVRAMVVHVVTGQDAGRERVPAGMSVLFYDLDEAAARAWASFFASCAACSPTPGAAPPRPRGGERPLPPILFRIQPEGPEALARIGREILPSGGAVLVSVPPLDQRRLAVIVVAHPETGAELHLPAMAVTSAAPSCAVRLIGLTEASRAAAERFLESGEGGGSEDRALVVAAAELPGGEDRVRAEAVSVEELLPLECEG